MRDVQPLYSRGKRRLHPDPGGRAPHFPRPSRQHPAPAGAADDHQEEYRRSDDHDRVSDGLTGMLRHFLDQLHLDHVDTGDLLLLGLLFFLFREDADEELLVSLGLLLIL